MYLAMVVHGALAESVNRRPVTVVERGEIRGQYFTSHSAVVNLYLNSGIHSIGFNPGLSRY